MGEKEKFELSLVFIDDDNYLSATRFLGGDGGVAIFARYSLYKYEHVLPPACRENSHYC